jgi:ferredoxin
MASAPRFALVLPTCTGCGACVAPCAPRAITLEAERPGGFGDKVAVVDARRCTGCGDCVPACPHGAIGLRSRA